jgi:sugar (pentulose or hexulose) kinase
MLLYITRERTESPPVLAIDSSSSSARASLHNFHTNPFLNQEARSPYQLNITPDGGVKIDSDTLLKFVFTVTDQVLEKARKLSAKIGAVALDTFWHSIRGIDQKVMPLRPICLERCADAASRLR